MTQRSLGSVGGVALLCVGMLVAGANVAGAGTLFTAYAPEDWQVETKPLFFEAKLETDGGTVSFGMATVEGDDAAALGERIRTLISQAAPAAVYSAMADYERGTGGRRVAGEQFQAEYVEDGKDLREWYVVFRRPDRAMIHFFQYSAPAVEFALYEEIAREALQRIELHIKPDPGAANAVGSPVASLPPSQSDDSAIRPASAPVTNCDRLAAEASDPDAVAPGVSFEEINVEAAFEACVSAVETYPDEPRFMTQLGRVYQNFTDERNDPEKAIALYRRAAEKNYRHAFFSLGMMAKDGLLATGGRHFREEAADWLERAVAAGHVEAMVHLALILEERIGIPPDYERAAELLLAALRRGSESAADAVLTYPESRDHGTIWMLQERLFSEGYYHGETDGIFGTKTRQALELYARSGE
ncbi:MAG: SEL1-like repeat protein [Hyphomicrobiales bacterium]|nr:SEL1-like repeat protein [Hyphomicrobiales bacterium]